MRNSFRFNPSICRSATLAAAGLLALGWLAGAQAGVLMNSQASTPGNPQAKPTTLTYSFQDGAMRVETHNADGSTKDITLFRDQALYRLDPVNKTYMRFDKAQMTAMGDKMAQARQQMEARLQSMPPEQRAMVQQAMSRMGGGATDSSASAPDFTVKDLGKTDTIGGVKCAMWEVLENGQKKSELCAAAPAALPGGAEVLQTMQQLSEMSRTMMASLRQAPAASANRDSQNYWPQLQKIGGVPILSRSFDSSGKVETEMRLLDIKSQSLGAALFNVPADYKDRTPKMPQAGGN